MDGIAGGLRKLEREDPYLGCLPHLLTLVVGHPDDATLAAATPLDDTDRRRLELTRTAISEQMITYPPLARFPEVEDAGWLAIRDALTGVLSPREAVRAVQRAAEDVLSA